MEDEKLLELFRLLNPFQSFFNPRPRNCSQLVLGNFFLIQAPSVVCTVASWFRESRRIKHYGYEFDLFDKIQHRLKLKPIEDLILFFTRLPVLNFPEEEDGY